MSVLISNFSAHNQTPLLQDETNALGGEPVNLTSFAGTTAYCLVTLSARKMLKNSIIL